MIKLSDYVMRFVERLGIREVFGLAGGGCMHLLDSLGKNPDIEMVANLHEQCSAIGALGYSQYSENIGVALVTTGPGGTNAITGVLAAWIDSIPILVISGQVKRADLMTNKNLRQMGPQEADIIGMVQGITKYAVTVMEPESIRYHLEKAIFMALNGRKGPVWIDIPLDVQGSFIDEEQLTGFSEYDRPKYGIKNRIPEVYELLNASNRPVIVAGNGIRLSGAKEEFLELAKMLNIPILTTWKTVDLMDEKDPLYFGRPGAIASRGANFALQTSDLLIAIGARLDLTQIAFNYKGLAPKAKKIIVDIDENEIRKMSMDIDIEVAADAGAFIGEMAENISRLEKKDRTLWIEKCKTWQEKYPIILDEYRKHDNLVHPYIFIETLSDCLSRDAIIVPGSSGSCSEISSQAFKIKKGQRFINSPGLGSMGFGVAESIGVCFSSGKRKVICIIGDGGLQHNIQELELIRRYRLPIKIFVLNNGIYASIRNMQNRNFEGHRVACDEESGVTIPDTEKIAFVYGLRYERIEDQKTLRADIEKVLANDDGTICEVMVDKDIQTLPRTSTVVLENGEIISRPLEDLYPFLSREELEENLKIDAGVF